MSNLTENKIINLKLKMIPAKPWIQFLELPKLLDFCLLVSVRNYTLILPYSSYNVSDLRFRSNWQESPS